MTLSLSIFRFTRSQHRNSKQDHDSHDSSSVTTETETGDASPPRQPSPTSPPGPDLSETRKWLILLSIVLLVISIIFLILVLTAQTSVRPVVSSTWFIRIDLTNVFIIGATPTAEFKFLNTIARSLGLHDFYQVGLWNYCEGYNDVGITFCSSPTSLYYFNPVAILLSQLFAGATITLPANILSILNLIKLASSIMFGFFLTGFCLSILYFTLLPLSLLSSPRLSPKSRSRWAGFGIGLVGFLAALFTTAATVVGTVMFSIMRNVLTSQPMLNIGAEQGTEMLAFMWVASAAVLIAWLLQWRCAWCCRGCRERKAARREKAPEKTGGEKGSWVTRGLRKRGNKDIDDL